MRQIGATLFFLFFIGFFAPLAEAARPRVVEPVSSAQAASFEASESWTGGSADTTLFKEGTQGRAVTSSGSLVTASYVFSQTKNLSAGAYFECWVYVPVADINDLVGLAIYVVKDSGSTNYATYTFTSGIAAGWNRLRVNRYDMTTNGTWTSADFSAVAQVRVGVQSKTGTSATVTFDDFRNVERIAQVLIGFDDGLITVYRDAMPIVEKYGYKLNFFVATSQVGVNPNYETWENLRTMRDRGHIIGFHFHADSDYGDGNDTFQSIKIDMQTGIDKLKAEGFTAPFHYAASQGRVTANADSHQRDLFVSGRRNTYPSSFGYHNIPEDYWSIWGQMPVTSTSLSTFQGWIDTAIEQQRGLEIVWHHMDPTADSNGVSPAVFETQIAYINQKNKEGKLEVIDRDSFIKDYFYSRPAR